MNVELQQSEIFAVFMSSNLTRPGWIIDSLTRSANIQSPGRDQVRVWFYRRIFSSYSPVDDVSPRDIDSGQKIVKGRSYKSAEPYIKAEYAQLGHRGRRFN